MTKRNPAAFNTELTNVTEQIKHHTHDKLFSQQPAQHHENWNTKCLVV